MQTSSLGREKVIHHLQIGKVAIGTTVTLGSGFLGFISAAIPVLQAFSLLVSGVVGVLTAIWWIRKLRKEK